MMIARPPSRATFARVGPAVSSMSPMWPPTAMTVLDIVWFSDLCAQNVECASGCETGLRVERRRGGSFVGPQEPRTVGAERGHALEREVQQHLAESRAAALR